MPKTTVRGVTKKTIKLATIKPLIIEDIIMPNINDITKSTGTKRTAASLLEILQRLFWWVPGIGDVLGYLAVIFGVTGLAHATTSSTLTKNKAATITTVLGLVVKATTLFHIVILYPYLPFINQIIVALGGVAVGIYAAKKK